MSYIGQSALAADQDFLNRVAACAAVEVPLPADPRVWATNYVWHVAAAPGFADAYTYAIESDPPVERPGADPAVITDAQILSAVQAVQAEVTGVTPQQQEAPPQP